MARPSVTSGLKWSLCIPLRASTQRLTLLAIFLVTLDLSTYAQPFKIMVAGDGRADYPDPNDLNRQLSPRVEDKSGFNDTINSEISKQVQEEKADMLLWTGDIVNVNYMAGSQPGDKTKFFKDGLNAWRKIMEPLYKNHVKVLPTRGNHEVIWYDESQKAHRILDAKKIWTELFSGPYAPLATDFDPQHLSFYYVQGSVLMIGLDQYENEYDDHRVNQEWLEAVLKKETKPFIFAYGHEPAFATGGRHPPAESLAAFPDERDKMWKTLSDAGAQIYLCGHDHFYDRMRVRFAKGGYEMWQITAGTAGAPFYCTGEYPDDKNWRLEREKHLDFVYGYLLITIDRNKATVEFKGRDLDGQYRTKDSFGYTAKSR